MSYIFSDIVMYTLLYDVFSQKTWCYTPDVVLMLVICLRRWTNFRPIHRLIGLLGTPSLYLFISDAV